MARKDLDQWLWQIGSELQRLGEEMTPSSPTLARCTGWEPRIDVLEAEDYVLIRAEIAGCRTEDVRLTYEPDENRLILRGVRTQDDSEERYRAVHQLEIFYGEFVRDIRLPDGDFDIDEMHAHYHNGFLSIRVPRTNQRPAILLRRTITIKRV